MQPAPNLRKSTCGDASLFQTKLNMKNSRHQIGTRFYDGLELRALKRRAAEQGRSIDAVVKEMIEQTLRIEELFGGAGQPIYLPHSIKDIVDRIATEKQSL